MKTNPTIVSHTSMINKASKLMAKIAKIRQEIYQFINNPYGKKTVKLSTGETALDLDDAWLIIGNKDKVITPSNCPFLRDKRDQRLKEKNPAYQLPVPSRDDLICNWETDRLLDLIKTIVKQ